MTLSLSSISHRIWLFFHSIRFRLALWSVAILAVILLIFCAFIYTRQIADLQATARAQLNLKAQQIQLLFRIAGMFEHEGGFQSTDLTQNEKTIIHDNDLLAVVDSNGQFLQKIGKPDNAAILQLAQTWSNAGQPNTSVTGTADIALPGQRKPTRYVFIVVPTYSEHQWIGLAVLAQPLDPAGQLPRLVFTLLLGSLATLGLVLAGGYWLADRAMSPVRTITRTARGISETDLHKRLRLNTQDELGQLANTFDAMLDRLEAAFDRQRQFTADASHELRTPLTIVGLEADHALARRRSPDEYERAMQVIKAENEYMAHLVSDLLTLARMDAGQTKVKLEPLDLSDVTLDVVERLAPLARRDGVEMITGELPEVRIPGDRQQLTQMLTNLVENAIKYAAIGGRHVWVDTGCGATAGNDPAWVRVADDGPGIPAEHLPHLFDRFYRVDQARARQSDESEADGAGNTPQGSGLGLSIVQWIVQAHHGQVVVQSEEGKGTLFEVRLPCAD